MVFEQQMPVAIECGLNQHMSELMLNELRMCALLNRQRDIRMAKIVESESPPSCSLESRFKLLPHDVARIERLSGRRTKDQIGLRMFRLAKSVQCRAESRCLASTDLKQAPAGKGRVQAEAGEPRPPLPMLAKTPAKLRFSPSGFQESRQVVDRQEFYCRSSRRRRAERNARIVGA